MFDQSKFQSKEKNSRLFYLKVIQKTPSNPTSIEEFKSVIFENGQLEYREVSKLRAFLPVLVNQASNFDVEDNKIGYLETNRLPHVINYRFTT